MGDIQNRKLLYLKAALLVFAGLLACAVIVIENPSWKTVLLLAIAIWAFARAYYFAFYVVQHYADPQFKFAGLLSFVRYLLGKKRR